MDEKLLADTSRAYLLQREELDKRIDKDAIKTREGAGGMSLSYVSGYYIRNRLNQVLGHGNWGYTSQLKLVHEGVFTDRYGKEKTRVSYIADVVLTVKLADGRITNYGDSGNGHGRDSDPGQAHESACKEAITDGLKRCATNLGLSFGLELYDADRDDTNEQQSKPEKSTPVRKTVESKNATKLQEQVRSIAKVVIAKGIQTTQELQSYLSDNYGVSSSAQLDDKQATEVLAHFNQLATGGK